MVNSTLNTHLTLLVMTLKTVMMTIISINFMPEEEWWEAFILYEGKTYCAVLQLS